MGAWQGLQSINLGIDQVTALPGKTCGEGVISRKVFNILKDITIEDPNDFTVSFEEWEIKSIKLNVCRLCIFVFSLCRSLYMI